MKAVRRDHYISPVTGEDTENALELAIAQLAADRGLGG